MPQNKMGNIDTSILTDGAKHLFEVFSKSPELEGITLVGGSALALQIGHRMSLDFDFATFNQRIPIRNIDALISRLKSSQQDLVHEIVDPEGESRFRINYGESLRNYARDYVINNVKVTFFAQGKNDLQRKFYSEADKIQSEGMVFNVLGIEGLKASKTLVLADRVKSRDLYDLMILFKDHAYSIDDALSTVKEIGHLDDPEHYRAVMTGTIPLDEKDEGLMSVEVDCDISSIYDFFENEFDIHDIKKAASLFSGNT